MIDWRARAEEFQAEAEFLREQNLSMRIAFSGDILNHAILGFTRMQAAIFSVLMTHRRVSHEGMLMALYSHRPGDAMMDDSIKVQLSHMRRKLRPHAIEIVNIWGIGYEIPEPDKVRARQIMFPADAGAASDKSETKAFPA